MCLSSVNLNIYFLYLDYGLYFILCIKSFYKKLRIKYILVNKFLN